MIPSVYNLELTANPSIISKPAGLEIIRFRNNNDLFTLCRGNAGDQRVLPRLRTISNGRAGIECHLFPGRSIGSVGLRDLCPSDCVPGDSDPKKQRFLAVSLMAVRVSWHWNVVRWF